MDEFSELETLEKKVNAWLNANLPNYDLVMVADFGHGLIRGQTVDLLSTKAKSLAINVQTNSANRGFNLATKYKRADFVCLDAAEARLATGDQFADLSNVCLNISSELDNSAAVVTNGKHGALLFDGEQVNTVPAFSQSAVDTIGAGDAFFCIAAISYYVSSDLRASAFLGNANAGLKIRSIGHSTRLSRVDLTKYLKSLLA